MSSYKPQAYDAAVVLMNAIKTAGAKGGKVNRADVLAAIKATRDYRGVLGIPITFDAKGDIAAAPVNIFRVEGGDFVHVQDRGPLSASPGRG